MQCRALLTTLCCLLLASPFLADAQFTVAVRVTCEAGPSSYTVQTCLLVSLRPVCSYVFSRLFGYQSIFNRARVVCSCICVTRFFTPIGTQVEGVANREVHALIGDHITFMIDGSTCGNHPFQIRHMNSTYTYAYILSMEKIFFFFVFLDTRIRTYTHIQTYTYRHPPTQLFVLLINILKHPRAPQSVPTHYVFHYLSFCRQRARARWRDRNPQQHADFG